MKLSTITTYLDTYLKTSSIGDYRYAKNGLQLQNNGKVTRVALAVDACQAVIEEAVEKKADLLIIHHGLFWSGLQPLTGSFYQKIKLAMDHNLAIYSSHLPLDLHPKIGNNILLAKELGLHACKPAFKIEGELVGFTGEVKKMPRNLFVKKVSKAVESSVNLAPGGPATVKKVLVVTGGAGSEVVAAAAEGIDTFVTGEGPHWSYTAAEELGINLIYAGHYATETFGVKAVGKLLSKKFGLPASFIHHPTGL